MDNDEMLIGAQLYTLRHKLVSESDVRRGLYRLKVMGYSGVELAGFGKLTPEQWAEILEEVGLCVLAMHCGLEDITDLPRLIDAMGVMATKEAVFSWLPLEYLDDGGLPRFLDIIVPVAAELQKYGMRLSYHNHNHEFVKYGRSLWIENFCQKLPEGVFLEFDTYWLQAAGCDVVAWIEKYCSKISLLHVKDMQVSPDGKQLFAPVGEGNMNFEEIIFAAVKGGVSRYVVEQDDCYSKDPFELLALSYTNLSRLFRSSNKF